MELKRTGEWVQVSEDGGVRVRLDGNRADDAASLPSPTTGDVVYVHFVGRLLSEEDDEEKSVALFNNHNNEETLRKLSIFEDTRERQSEFTFTLDREQTITGLELAVPCLKEGDRATIFCSSAHAFASAGNPHGFHGSGKPIPPRSALIFQLELLHIEPSEPYGDTSGLEKYELNPKKLELAEQLKQSGNALFLRQHMERALLKYRRALFHLQAIHLPTDEEEQRADHLLLLCHSNAAACYLKLDQPKAALDACREALQRSSSSSSILCKTLFRMGKAHAALNDHEEALEAFEKALQEIKEREGTKEAAEIQKEAQRVKRLQQEAEKKQRRFYGNMLQKTAAVSLYSEEELRQRAEEDRAAKMKQCTICGEMVEEVQWARHIVKKHS